MTEEKLKERIRRRKWALIQIFCLIVAFVLGYLADNKYLMIGCCFMYLLINHEMLAKEIEDLEEEIWKLKYEQIANSNKTHSK